MRHTLPPPPPPPPSTKARTHLHFAVVVDGGRHEVDLDVPVAPAWRTSSGDPQMIDVRAMSITLVVRHQRRTIVREEKRGEVTQEG